MRLKVKKILDDYGVLHLTGTKITKEICQIFPKSNDNPNGYELPSSIDEKPKKCLLNFYVNLWVTPPEWVKDGKNGCERQICGYETCHNYGKRFTESNRIEISGCNDDGVTLEAERAKAFSEGYNMGAKYADRDNKEGCQNIVEKIFQEADSPCAHFDIREGTHIYKRVCDSCWQALKKQEGINER